MGMLAGKVAFITGGASGIGEGTARRFAQEGARVALADVQDEAGERLSRELGGNEGRAVSVHCDVREPRSVQAAIERTVQEFGRLDIVFANAGINGMLAPIEDLSPRSGTRRWRSTSPAPT